jgi:hypothetical protein
MVGNFSMQYLYLTNNNNNNIILLIYYLLHYQLNKMIIYFNLDESTITTKLKVNIPLEEITPIFQSLPTSILTPPSDNYFFPEDQMDSDNDYLQIQNELLE